MAKKQNQMKKIIAMFAIVAVLALTLGASAAQTVVSRGKSYDLVTQPGDGYPDTEAKLLTDGKSGIEDKNGFFYTSDAYVGFPAANVNDEGNFVIILDLGEVMENLTEFDVGYLNETNPRIYAPTKVTVSVSSTARNGEYTTVATKDIDEPTDDGQSKAGVVNLKLEQPTSAQYVKFEITRRAKFTNGDLKSIRTGSSSMRSACIRVHGSTTRRPHRTAPTKHRSIPPTRRKAFRRPAMRESSHTDCWAS